ncbi:hypothetical protein K438DRAFT_2020608 [Mycena galopus ATCC 62051]|nr:hypothetical protein K438DRAFT_2020608 [Mycena galopus ATCC 62051]
MPHRCAEPTKRLLDWRKTPAPLARAMPRYTHDLAPASLSTRRESFLDLGTSIPQEQHTVIRLFKTRPCSDMPSTLLPPATQSRELDAGNVGVPYTGAAEGAGVLYCHSCFNGVDLPLDNVIGLLEQVIPDDNSICTDFDLYQYMMYWPTTRTLIVVGIVKELGPVYIKLQHCYIPYHPVPLPAESGLPAYYATRLITILRHYAGLPLVHILQSAGLQTSVRPLAEDGFLRNEVF